MYPVNAVKVHINIHMTINNSTFPLFSHDLKIATPFLPPPLYALGELISDNMCMVLK